MLDLEEENAKSYVRCMLQLLCLDPLYLKVLLTELSTGTHTFKKTLHFEHVFHWIFLKQFCFDNVHYVFVL